MGVCCVLRLLISVKKNLRKIGLHSIGSNYVIDAERIKQDTHWPGNNGICTRQRVYEIIRRLLQETTETPYYSHLDNDLR